jgi:hypothetical protein
MTVVLMSQPDESQERWVSKVHPLAREVGPEDPLELMSEVVVGDPGVMLECILQEFVWMGWGAGQLLTLFQHPGYPLLCQLREFYGDAEVERRVHALLAGSGQLQFRESIAEPDEEPDHGPELIQITLNPALAD